MVSDIPWFNKEVPMSTDHVPTLADLFRALWYGSMAQEATAPKEQEPSDTPEDVPQVHVLPGDPEEVVVVLHAVAKGPVTIHIGRRQDLNVRGLPRGTVMVFLATDVIFPAIEAAATAAETMKSLQKFRIA